MAPRHPAASRPVYQASGSSILICPDFSTTLFTEFGSFCPDKITHWPSRPTDFVRIVYQALRRYCRGSWRRTQSKSPSRFGLRQQEIVAGITDSHHSPATTIQPPDAPHAPPHSPAPAFPPCLSTPTSRDTTRTTTAPAMPEQRKLSELPIPLPPSADYNKQSVAVPGTERPGETGESPIVRRYRSKEILTKTCVTRSYLPQL